MTTNQAVTLTINNAVAEIRICRPESLNALDTFVLQGLSDVFNQLAKKCQGLNAFEDCRVATISGEGSKAFVAGADIKLMQRAAKAEVAQFLWCGQKLMREIELLPLPVIAVLDGFALGGGLELALACDLIIATEKAKVGQPEVNLGLIPGFGGTQRLVHRVGVAAAKRLIYTAEMISAEEAFRIGLVDWLVPSGELQEKVRKTCEIIICKGPLALQGAKRAIEQSVQTAKLSGLTKEVEEFLVAFDSADAREGLNAFLEKRQPKFRGI